MLALVLSLRCSKKTGLKGRCKYCNEILIFSCSFSSTSGDIPYVDLGCFVDTGNPSTMPEMLLTDTDSHSPLFSGVAVKRELKNWDDYMSNLICRYVIEFYSSKNNGAKFTDSSIFHLV